MMLLTGHQQESPNTHQAQRQTRVPKGTPDCCLQGLRDRWESPPQLDHTGGVWLRL